MQKEKHFHLTLQVGITVNSINVEWVEHDSWWELPTIAPPLRQGEYC